MRKIILRIIFKSGFLYDYPIEIKENESINEYIDNINSILSSNSDFCIKNKNDESIIKVSEISSFIIFKNVNS